MKCSGCWRSEFSSSADSQEATKAALASIQGGLLLTQARKTAQSLRLALDTLLTGTPLYPTWD